MASSKLNSPGAFADSMAIRGSILLGAFDDYDFATNRPMPGLTAEGFATPTKIGKAVCGLECGQLAVCHCYGEFRIPSLVRDGSASNRVVCTMRTQEGTLWLF